jgi:hypothetical protein
MRRYFIFLIVFFTSLNFNQKSIVFGETLEEKLEKVEKLSGELEKARNFVISNTNISLVLMGLLLAILTAVTAFGIFESRRVIRRRIDEKIKEEVTKQVQENGKKFIAEVLGIEKKDLEGEFRNILQRLDYHENLLNLLSSSEDIQARGISYFITKPAKGNPLVISILTKFEQSRNFSLYFQSLIARDICGDPTAKVKQEAAASFEGEQK